MNEFEKKINEKNKEMTSNDSNKEEKSSKKKILFKNLIFN